MKKDFRNTTEFGKKICFVWLMMGLCAGCATVPAAYHKELVSSNKINQVSPGVSPEEVKAILGAQVVTGYEVVGAVSKEIKPITISNPYRSETLAIAGKSYVVDYYFVAIKHPDDVITDDELVPMIYQEKKLIGKGWDFLNGLKNKN